jgi:serine/threonine-protein kinase
MSAAGTDATTIAALNRAFGDRYAIQRVLGHGGMGTVLLARVVKLDRPVALKVLQPEFGAQSGLRDRFLRETRTAASFSHPNIVPVYAVDEADGLLAYAMGFVEGETLAERVARTGPLGVRDLVKVMQDVAYALAYAHGRGVVHRDIKPDNIMLERATGRALVMDFGISRSIAHAATSTATNLTRVGEVVGTPQYMSPEQASGDVVDGRSDLYSLGLTAYFAATGRPAVSGENTQQILARQLAAAIPPVEQVRRDLPASLAEAIDRCVEKDPAARFQTAEALVDALDASQLAEREIPLPVRLFVGELSSLSFAMLGAIVLVWVVVDQQRSAHMSDLDTALPVVGLLAVMIARVMTTVAEARRLAEAGFSSDEALDGMRRVMAEHDARRQELRADPRTRRRRRTTLIRGAGMVVAAIVMIRVALASRVRIGPTSYQTPPLAITLVFTGFALLGAGFVLLLRSPFRMSPPERLFRWIWIGPVGRAFVRLSMRRAGSRPGVGRGTGDDPSVAWLPAPEPASAASPRGATSPGAARDPIAALEERVASLERWRRETRG